MILDLRRQYLKFASSSDVGRKKNRAFLRARSVYGEDVAQVPCDTPPTAMILAQRG
jgi:hypothetical protein